MSDVKPPPGPAPLDPIDRVKLLTKFLRDLADLTDRDRGWLIDQMADAYRSEAK